ncbi:MAG: hypothetical protein LIR40_04545 [Bacteroidota bacterium]|nr:hypothetical protein [Bacteroidota bacterium]
MKQSQTLQKQQTADAISRIEVIAELQKVINIISNTPDQISMSMVTRQTGVWNETIIQGGCNTNSIVVNIFTQEEAIS